MWGHLSNQWRLNTTEWCNGTIIPTYHQIYKRTGENRKSMFSNGTSNVSVKRSEHSISCKACKHQYKEMLSTIPLQQFQKLIISDSNLLLQVIARLWISKGFPSALLLDWIYNLLLLVKGCSTLRILNNRHPSIVAAGTVTALWSLLKSLDLSNKLRRVALSALLVTNLSWCHTEMHQ